jgi:adenine-specific DNA-methyltransferase
MATALRKVIEEVRARVLVLSYNDESWATLEELVEWCSPRGHVESLSFDSKRYVGAQIGIHNPSGEKVGEVDRLRNLEYLVVAGQKSDVRSITAPYVVTDHPQRGNGHGSGLANSKGP